MATRTNAKSICCRCQKPKNTLRCGGCSKEFCYEDLNQHRNELNEQLSEVEDQFNRFKTRFNQVKSHLNSHQMIKEIDQWEQTSIRYIQLYAQEMRNELSLRPNRNMTKIDEGLQLLADDLHQCREENDFLDKEIQRYQEELKRLKELLQEPSGMKLKYEKTSFIDRVYLCHDRPSPRSADLDRDATWSEVGKIVAGGNGEGTRSNQLSAPCGICVVDKDQDSIIYIADQNNDRIMEWSARAREGRVVAGGNGQGRLDDQLSSPRDVIIDRKNNDLIISDLGNRRIVQWSLDEGTTRGRTIISNIDCFGITIDEDDQSIYIVDRQEQAVKRYRPGDTRGIVVAGGNGQGNGLHQLSRPARVFVDRAQTIYVSDMENDRIMKWVKNAKEGVIVAGCDGRGNGLKQLHEPIGVVVDGSGNIYVCDSRNDRLVRYCEGATDRKTVAYNDITFLLQQQLSDPVSLSFDRQGNLYVVEWSSHRVLKFDLQSKLTVA